jgi:peptidoglycan/xylan/chitin deacetylase (PgdA/CDA1 family)
MRIFPAKTPKFVKSLFPQFVWQVPTDKKELYLTFDDGPTPAVTPWVVDCLNSYEAKATFFCIGKNIEQHPDIFDAVINAGHSVGNHTQHHLKGWKTSTKVYVENVIQAQRYFKDETEMQLFRPPYGKFKIAQARELINLGYKVILWDVLSYDWMKL